jgi:hypothetical protein
MEGAGTMSAQQQAYLKQIKKYKLFITLSRIFLFVIFLFLWEISATTGLIDSFIFSSPSKVICCFWNMILSGFIFVHLWTTFYETLVSFLLEHSLKEQNYQFASGFWLFISSHKRKMASQRWSYPVS